MIAEQSQYKAIFLSDYCDIGPSSIMITKVLSEAKTKHPDWVFIRGNNNQMLLDLIEERYLVEDEGELEFGSFLLAIKSVLLRMEVA